jgi:hypothetical protein
MAWFGKQSSPKGWQAAAAIAVLIGCLLTIAATLNDIY